MPEELFLSEAEVESDPDYYRKGHYLHYNSKNYYVLKFDLIYNGYVCREVNYQIQ